MLALILAAALSASEQQVYERILAADDAAMKRPVSGNLVGRGNARARLRRVEAAYRHFIASHPDYAPAVADYAGFLYDQGRQGEAVALWERAIRVDPGFARAYNDVATHYGHFGRAADALRYYRKAIELEPGNAVYHFNWATTCLLFRNEARQVYGWSDDEIFRRSLDEFRAARDLDTHEYEYATAYAESFIFWAKADWAEALEAWRFCVKAAPTEEDRQRAYCNAARVSLRLNRKEEARAWLEKVTIEELQPLRRQLMRRLSDAATP
jgi:tetratricopeptide (TPR) repeat protein